MAEDSIPEQYPSGQPFSSPFHIIYQHHVIISAYNRKKDIIATNMTEEELISQVVKPFNEELRFGIEEEVLLPEEIKQIKITKSSTLIHEELYGDLWNSVNSAEDVTAKFITKKVGESRLIKRFTPSRDKPKSCQATNIAVIDLFNSMVTHVKIKEASINHFRNGEYRSAVLDAAITLEEMVKRKAKVPKDNNGKELSGYRLMHVVFDVNKPILSWCKNERQIERDELEGYKLIFAGTVQGIRDPKAHAIFQIDPERALKLLSLVTLLAELVDASEFIPQKAEKVKAQPIMATTSKKAILEVPTVTTRIREDLIYLQDEIKKDLQKKAFQSRAFPTDVYVSLREGLMRELSIGTYRKIQNTYNAIELLRFPTNEDLNQKNYKAALTDIVDCLKLL